MPGSLLSLVLVTMDRYISVVYALHYPSLVTMRRARIAVCCMWGFNIILNVGTGAVSSWRMEYSKDSLMCSFADNHDFGIYMQAAFSSITTITLTIMLVVYTRLFLISRSQARRIRPNDQLARPSDRAIRTLLTIMLAALVFPTGCESSCGLTRCVSWTTLGPSPSIAMSVA